MRSHAMGSRGNSKYSELYAVPRFQVMLGADYHHTTVFHMYPVLYQDFGKTEGTLIVWSGIKYSNRAVIHTTHQEL